MAEIDVAPLPLRQGTLIAALAPSVGENVMRWFGSESIAEDLARGHRGKG